MSTPTNSNEFPPTFTWERVGAINLCSKEKPEFPNVSPSPGLYRITLSDGRSYIGEASNLAHRMSEYRTPTGIEQEQWICACLREAKGGSLDVILGDHLADKKLRNQIERSEIAKARERGATLLNGHHDQTTERVLHKIAFHEKQIVRLRNLLTKLESEVVQND